jgi:hypothetical protein
MIIEGELLEALDLAFKDFLLKKIRKKSLAYKTGRLKIFDKGSKLLIEREGDSPVEILTKKITARIVLKNEYLRNSDFGMVKEFFASISDKIVDAESAEIIEALQRNAGIQVNSKGDIL